MTPEELKAYKKAWNEKHKEERKERVYLKKYGITATQFWELCHDQEGFCAICGIDAQLLPKRMAIDHDHQTGKVRALLCNLCNRMIARDDPAILINGARYLKEHHARY